MNDNTPVSVNYAVGLCGLLAGMLALSAFGTLGNGKAGVALVDVLMMVVFLALAWGLRRGSRVARVAALIVGGLVAVSGLLLVVSGTLLGLLLLVPAALLVVALSIPSGARQFFARENRRVGVS